LLKHFAGIGSGKVDDPQGIGQVDHVIIPAVIAGMIAKPLDGAPGTAGGGGKIILIFPAFHDHTVIDDTAVFIAHGSVFDLAVGYFRHVAGINPLQRLQGIRPPDSEFTQSGCIQHTHVVAHIFNFFTAAEILGKIACSFPDTDAAHDAAGFHLGII